ncbi:LysR family glycine cleavage system transcriptional activator [Bradyrhizobium sp. USDA 4461]
MTSSHIPPLQLLRGFEAAARHLSFTRAAAELHITHGAISHQIRALEAQLRTKLFQRQGRQMVLTERGQVLVTQIRQGLRLLERAFEGSAQRARSDVLTISLLPAFASRWLIPRIGSFHTHHPGIQLALRTTTELANLASDGVDLAIRYGPGGWPGVQQERLIGELVFPVCSPNYRDGDYPRSLPELAQADLLLNPHQPWEAWFNAAGADIREPHHGTSYTDAALLLEAAAEGHGIALARGTLVADDLRSGRLVRLFDCAISDEYSYFMVWRAESRKLKSIAIFRDWMLGQLRPSDEDESKTRVAFSNESSRDVSRRPKHRARTAKRANISQTATSHR